MVDIEAAIRSHLASKPALTSLVGARVYAGVSPPPGYKPSTNGPCVLFGVRGGTPDYTGRVLKPSMQFKCYGRDEAEARAVDRALFDVAQDVQGCDVLIAEQETIGQLLAEPQTEWRYVLSFWLFSLRNFPAA